MHILLATDGKPASSGAISCAMTLEKELDAKVRAVRVVHPVSIYAPVGTPLQFVPEPSLLEELSQGALAEAARQLSSAGPSASRWPLTVEIGPVPLTIVRCAADHEASLIVIGAGRHGRVERWFGTETALGVTQLSHIPVLAVPEGADGSRPRRVVVAIDFSPFSRDALAAAARLATTGAELHLVYVLPSGEDVVRVKELDDGQAYAESVRNDLEKWAASVGLRSDVSASFHLLEGKPSEEILGLAEKVGADLIAAGSHGSGFFARAVLGSVSTRLLRSAGCSILIAPPRERAREFGIEG